jgi:hypothetical protein
MSGLDLPRVALREPGVANARDYARRVRGLAVVHPCLFVASIVGFVLLIWRGEFFVTLSQRSNVETLTIAFFLLYFGYFAVVTAHGALGSVRIALFALRARLSRDPRGVDAARVAVLGKRGPGAAAAFDKAIELEGRPGQPWEIELHDASGSLGRLRISGVRVEHLDTFRDGSNTLLAYLERKITAITGSELTIVHWRSTGGEELLQYAVTSDALRALGDKLSTRVWPTIVLGDAQRLALEREMCALCPALRDEAFLPDWEFEGEHKLPIIPEPLGIISLSRAERRVDPLASLSSVLVMVVIVVAVICFFLARPPWLPGK